MAVDRNELEALLRGRGYLDFRWIDPKKIVVAQWVRVKCMFGCSSFGRDGTCPPNTPSVAECRLFFDEYDLAAVIRFTKRVDRPEDRGPWSRKVNADLLNLERAVFLAGYHKAFLLAMDSCRLCAECSGSRQDCKNLEAARPSPESFAVDVFGTVRQIGYPIEVLTDYTDEMNRYAFLLVE